MFLSYIFFVFLSFLQTAVSLNLFSWTITGCIFWLAFGCCALQAMTLQTLVEFCFLAFFAHFHKNYKKLVKINAFWAYSQTVVEQKHMSSTLQNKKQKNANFRLIFCHFLLQNLVKTSKKCEKADSDQR